MGIYLGAYIRGLISGVLISGGLYPGAYNQGLYPWAYILGHISGGLYPGYLYLGAYIRGTYIWGLIVRAYISVRQPLDRCPSFVCFVYGVHIQVSGDVVRDFPFSLDFSASKHSRFVNKPSQDSRSWSFRFTKFSSVFWRNCLVLGLRG